MPFEIFVVQHSHIDIGYTERQEKITDYQSQFIAQAVKYANSEKQNGRSSDALFKFTCEGFWAVEQYLKKFGPEGKVNLIAAIKKGYLELSPFYVHLAELLDEGHIRESLQFAADFALENNLPLHAAMSSDVNGLSWSMADALADLGIEYLITNINSHHGGAPFGKPLVPFYWESPRGRKILVWSGLAYHKGNLLGLMPGYNPFFDPGIPGMTVSDQDGYINMEDLTFQDGFTDVQDISLAEKRLFPMVDTLANQGYPYHFLPVMGSALYTDNSPVSDEYCNLIGAWNQKHGDKIHLQTATLEEFFIYLKEHGGKIPTYRGDWNDWWTDGVISTPLEVKLFRNAQRTKRMVEMLDSEQRIVPKSQLQEITKNLVLFSEHTWGHSSSFTDPWRFLVQQLAVRKSKFAVEADELAAKALDNVLKGLGEGGFTSRRPFEYKVINPLNTAQKSVVLLPVDFWEVFNFNQGFTVTDHTGKNYPYQHTNTLRGWMVAVEIILNPNEERELILAPGATIKEVDGRKPIGEMTFENDHYKVNWSQAGIGSFVWKETGSQLIRSGEESLGMPVYQVFPGGNRKNAAGFAYKARTKPTDIKTWGKIKSVKVIESGPVFTIVKAEYQIPGASCYRVFYTFYPGLARIDLRVEMTKDIILDPEGMYTAFPFAITDGKWNLDKPGALILPGRDQLPGTCCDYYAVSNGAILAGSKEGICISILDAPLVTIGGIKLWDYTTTINPTGTLYSWLCNNKWDTNFKADCGGFYEFRYVIECSKEFSDPNKAVLKMNQNLYDALVVRK